MLIRPEEEKDYDAVRMLNVAAFESPAESKLVDALRQHAESIVSLVAVLDGKVAGHILFSPVALANQERLNIMGLAPMAVLPEHQRQGVGSALIEQGLKQCKGVGCQAVVVLGHPEYYPRFGFVPASRYGVSCEYDVPDDVFMALEIEPNALQNVSGLVRYHAAFAEL